MKLPETLFADVDGWEEKTEHFIRVNYIPKGSGWAFIRDIPTFPSSAHGLTAEDIKELLKGASKNSSAYLIEVKAKRIV